MMKSLNIKNGFADPLVNFPRIPLALKGLRRAQSLAQKRPEVLSITALVLLSIKLHNNFVASDDLMLWATYCTMLMVNRTSIGCFPLPKLR